ncbi:hypothetical protein EV363DRAFT_1154943, partial [Boletus edulis]
QVPSRRGRYSKNPKGTVETKPWHMGFYPPLWTQLLETAKGEMRCSLFRQHPFLPDKRTAVDGECYEVLLSVIARYEKEQLPVERTGVNNYKLYDNIGSFRSVIKKAAQDAIPSGYAVLAPISAVSREARTTAVKAQATALLQDAEYLHGTPNEQGKKAYFSHAVLKRVCLSVFYPDSRKSLRTFPEFQQSLPVKALVLVTAIVHFVLTVYKNHGKDTNPSLNAKELEASYYRFLQSIQAVARHHSKGPRFEKMLASWASEGM